MLAPFSEESQEKVQKGIKDTVKAVLGTLEVGIDKGMNQFNPKRRPTAINNMHKGMSLIEIRALYKVNMSNQEKMPL